MFDAETLHITTASVMSDQFWTIIVLFRSPTLRFTPPTLGLDQIIASIAVFDGARAHLNKLEFAWVSVVPK